LIKYQTKQFLRLGYITHAAIPDGTVVTQWIVNVFQVYAHAAILDGAVVTRQKKTPTAFLQSMFLVCCSVFLCLHKYFIAGITATVTPGRRLLVPSQFVATRRTCETKVTYALFFEYERNDNGTQSADKGQNGSNGKLYRYAAACKTADVAGTAEFLGNDDAENKGYDCQKCKQCAEILDVAANLGDNKRKHCHHNAQARHDCGDEGKYGKPFCLSFVVIGEERRACSLTAVGFVRDIFVGHTVQKVKHIVFATRGATHSGDAAFYRAFELRQSEVEHGKHAHDCKQHNANKTLFLNFSFSHFFFSPLFFSSQTNFLIWLQNDV